jgi:quercetin dioxygenase-like cupin family protein
MIPSDSEIIIMPFINFNSGKKLKLFEGITGTFAHSEQSSFGYVTLEKGARAIEHHHVHEQWTHVLSGELEFTLGDEKKILTPGMSAYIPSNVPHSAYAITECKVMDCFSPVREDFVELEKKTA